MVAPCPTTIKTTMSDIDLPFRATVAEACAWLARQLPSVPDSDWTLARLLELELTPYVWLDYEAAHPELFGNANGGYAAPIFFADDIARLAAGAEDVLITRTKDAYKLVVTLPAPGFRRPLADLRFQKRDLERLAGKLKQEAQDAAAPKPPETTVAARESQAGISKAEVLTAFRAIVRLDLDKALDDAIGLFGDDGARNKASAKRSKRNAVWNPVTLALGLHDAYRVPLGPLRRAFKTHDFLLAWDANWEQSLRLLGK
jgi:hypothetical protein